MNSQKVFDYIVSHLRAQNRKSVNKNGYSAYRGLEGRKSAIGWMIEDAEYSSEMEKLWPFEILDSEKFLPALKEKLRRHEKLLLDLQYIHDGSRQHWENGFASVARMHGLIYSPTDEMNPKFKIGDSVAFGGKKYTVDFWMPEVATKTIFLADKIPCELCESKNDLESDGGCHHRFSSINENFFEEIKERLKRRQLPLYSFRYYLIDSNGENNFAFEKELTLWK